MGVVTLSSTVRILTVALPALLVAGRLASAVLHWCERVVAGVVAVTNESLASLAEATGITLHADKDEGRDRVSVKAV